MKKLLIGVVVLLVAGLVAFHTIVPVVVDSRMNTVVSREIPAVSPQASALHRRIFVADLHADELLWGRDLLARVDRGHVDLPRLQEGRVALQVFSAVTKTPRDMNYDQNTGETDNITLLAMAQRWPAATRSSLRARAVYQAEQLQDAVLRAGGAMTLITTRDTLMAFAQRRAGDPLQVGALLAIEGLHALDGQLESVDVLFNYGYRMMGLTHFFDNEVAGSAHGVTHGGLTALGRQVVQRMEQRGIVVDLAHASTQTVQEVLAMATRPVVVSHTGVAAVCPGPRNLTDAQLKAIAANGGLIGIGYWDGAVCQPTIENIVKAIRHAVQVMGVRHVALGSDFDGATKTPWDTRGVIVITDALLKAGVSEDDVALIMGANTFDFLMRTLPSAS
ncbi:dipeptidase [Gemmatimonas phototrophica]|uniref:Peptidase M19 n=1 Tax=Gemmatimonas phototrophica TaxID=1379270 RepID=A0A143BGZ6_9BACT|nr:dipeptidase [Gemmatimonas phototrophica]AMW03895.1 peptidase M19 [Gemmatimonas phototrophica]